MEIVLRCEFDVAKLARKRLQLVMHPTHMACHVLPLAELPVALGASEGLALLMHGGMVLSKVLPEKEGRAALGHHALVRSSPFVHARSVLAAVGFSKKGGIAQLAW